MIPIPDPALFPFGIGTSSGAGTSAGIGSKSGVGSTVFTL